MAESTSIKSIQTNDTNVNVVSKLAVDVESPQENIREILIDDVVEKVRVGTFTKNGFIRLIGNYSQNFVDLPTYDLSVLNVINDEDVNFNFILCLKDGQDSEPQLYATSNFYKKLVENYNSNNPTFVNEVINQRNIIVVDIEPLKQKVEDLRVNELNLDINLTTTSEKKYVEVLRNLFVISNYQSDSVIGLKANPTYTLIELLRYISWVVTKPAQNYNDRILPANSLGQWGEIEDTIPSSDLPSTEITTTPTNDNNEPLPPTNLYPPIGRAGYQDEEEAYYNGKLYIWDALVEVWFENRGDDIGGRS